MTRRLMTTAALVALAAPLAAQDMATGPVLKQIAALPPATTTVQQRVEPVVSVPASVTPIAIDEFRLRGSGSVLPVLNALPGIVAVRAPGPGGASGVFVRGLGSGETLGGLASGVGTFVDGIRLDSNTNEFGLFDLARIDVVRGSQGVIFGRNTSGGAVDITLARPGERIAGNVEGGYGQYGRGLGRASLDLPVTTGIAVKVSGYYDASRGVARNSSTGDRIDDGDRWGARGAVGFKLGERLSWNLAAAYLRDEGETVPEFDCDPGNPSRCGGRFTMSPGQGIVQGLGSRIATQFYTSHLDYDLGGATLSAITGYIDTDQRYRVDFGTSAATSLVSSDGGHHKFSQELRLAGTLADGRLDYIAGGSYEDGKGRTAVADAAGGSLRADRTLRDETEATAAYAQLGYALIPALKLSGGVRYTDEDRHSEVVDNRATCRIVPQPATCLNATLDQSDGIWTPHAALTFKAAEAVTLYAGATRGYRGGGWNARSITSATLLPYASERAWTYEAGARTEFWDKRLRLNLTGFWLDVRDAQAIDAFAGAANAGKLRNRGVEIEAAAVPVTGLSLTASAGYQDAEYRDSALRPAYTPKLTASAGISYDYALPPRSGAIIVPSVIARYRSAFETTVLTPTPRTGSSVLVDAGLAVKTDDGNWILGIECLNCLDEEVVDSRVGGIAILNSARAWLIRARRVF